LGRPTALSAPILDLTRGDEQASRHLVAAGLIAAAPAALSGAADWSEQHEQQMRVGIVHAADNAIALALGCLSCLGSCQARLASGGRGRRGFGPV